MNAKLSFGQHPGWLWVCVGGLLLAAGVRLWHIDFDLPEVNDIDSVKFVGAAALVVETGNLQPVAFDPFQYPGGYIYLLAILYKLCGISEVYAQYLTARLVAVAGGLGMVAGAWWLARRLGGRFAACVAVLLTTLSVNCVTTSHLAYTDTLVACWMTLALAVAIVPAATARTWLIAGALAGLAVGTKFSGACVGPVIVLAAVVDGLRARRPWLALRNTSLIGLAAAGAFWLTTPRFPWDFWSYYERLRMEALLQSCGQLGHVQYGWFDFLISGTVEPERPWLYTSLLWNLGPLLLLVALLALAAALVGRRGQPGVIVALFIVGYLAMTAGPGHSKTARYLIPILPALFALVGWWLEDRLARLPLGRWPGVAAVVLLVALVAWPAERTTRYLALLRPPSTNALLRAWVLQNVPADAGLFASPFYTIDLSLLPIRVHYMTKVGQYRFPEDVGHSPEREPIFAPQHVEMLRQKVEYVVLNSYFGDFFSPTPENLRWFPHSVEAYAAFREELAAHADVVHTIVGFREGRGGPDMTVYRFRK